MDENVSNLKALTGWDLVYQSDTSYVIEFHESDLKSIRGIARNQDGFYLDADEFIAVPISFLVRSGTYLYQYWTLNRRLHRIGGHPAKIIYNTKTSTIKRMWYQSGILDRFGGPAIDTMFGVKHLDIHPETNNPVGGNRVTHLWKRREMEFFSNGIHSVYPRPQKITMNSNGYQTVKSVKEEFETRTFKQYILDHPDQPALSVPYMTIEWNSSYMFSPNLMTVYGMQERYKDGNFVSRTLTDISTQWNHNNEIKSSREFDAYIRDHMMNNINLLNGPFFQTEQDELIAQQEFSSLVK